MRPLGKTLKWGLLLVVLAAGAGVPYLWSRLDSEIRVRIEQKFADHYAGLRVRVKFAQLVEGEGIQVRGLTVEEPLANGGYELLIEVDEFFIYCQTSLSELASGMPQVDRFVMRHPRIRAVLRPDGSWNAAKLWPPPKFSETPIDGAIEGGSVEIFGLADASSSEEPRPLVLRDVNLAIETIKDATGAAWGKEPRRLRGSFLGDHHRRVEFLGHADLASSRWALAGDVHDMRLSPELIQSLPAPLDSRLSPISSLRGLVNFSFQVGHDEAQQPPLKFDLKGQIARGRIDDARLPYPLVDLKGLFRCTQAGFNVMELSAHNGQTVVKLNCSQTGYGPQATLDLHAECKRLMIDRQSVEFLPPQWRDKWPMFSPSGEIDGNLHLVRQGARWKPDLYVRCRGVSFAYDKFPYRLERMWGTLELKEERLRVDLLDGGGGEAVRISGELFRPGPDFTGWIDVEAHRLPFDEKLFEALNESPRRVVRSLHPSGTFDIAGRVWRNPGPDQPVHKHAAIDFNGCTLRYEKFAYPIEDIVGRMEVDDGRWTFARLEGSNDAGRIVAEGSIESPENGGEFQMKVIGICIAIEDELRGALNASTQRVWDEIRPRGMIDIESRVQYTPDTQRLIVWTKIEPQPATASIEPLCFPYRLEKLRGQLVYQDGSVRLSRVRAEHGRVNFATEGECAIDPQGGWRLSLRELAIDRLRPDRELLHAMPEKLRRAVMAMSFSGPLNLAGDVEFTRGKPGTPLATRWNLSLETNQGSVQLGLRLDNIQGGVKLVGGFDGQQLQMRGELQLDSVMYKDWQFTDVAGPFWVDDKRVLLGRWSEQTEPGKPERHITANLYGGQVAADGWSTLGDGSRFSVQAAFSDGDLATWARESGTTGHRLSGRVSGEIDLRGSGKELYNLRGRGSLQMRDADIYELPVMVSLLKLLSVREPNLTAFTKSDIEYRIEGEHIYFDRLDFNGDAVSLLGAGEMNFDKDIRASFHTVVGKGEFKLPVLRDIIGGVSRQTMQIHVGGTLSQPESRFEPFPALNQALQQLQVDLQPPATRIRQ
ncbi:MAG: AsmA-like C-terminal region-containing protein [Pirellulales bacterium]